MSFSLHFSGMFTVHGPYVVDYTDIQHDGDTKVLWTPQIGDVLIGLWGDRGTVISGTTGGGGFVNAGLQIGNVTTPDLFCPSNVLDFTDFRSSLAAIALPYVIKSVSPIRVKYVASGEGNLVSGHVELYALIARSPSA